MEENTESAQPVENTGQENALKDGIARLNQRVMRARQEVARAVVGQENTVDLILAALFTGGHILLEGVPGIAKTLTAKLIARSLSVDFSRLQFTPDLMPADLTGTPVWRAQTGTFDFVPGPVFHIFGSRYHRRHHGRGLLGHYRAG